MIVNYPFTIRRDTLLTKTNEKGSLDALKSELRILIATEEGDLVLVPDYGVRKRDLLFSGDIIEAKLGVLQARIDEKVAQWVSEDVSVDNIRVIDSAKNKVTLGITLLYVNSLMELEVIAT